MFDILIQYCYGLTVPSGLPHAQQSYVYSMQFIHPIWYLEFKIEYC